MENSVLFLENTYQFFPYKIHTILTDNGLQFSYKALKEELKPDNTHPFDKLCEAHNTEHRLTKFAKPWTNGQVEKMNHIIKSATLKLFHYENIDEYCEHLAKFLNYYNFENKLKSLKFKSPYDKIWDLKKGGNVYTEIILDCTAIILTKIIRSKTKLVKCQGMNKGMFNGHPKKM